MQMKRIIICCDGTWQNAIDVKTGASNIERIVETLRPTTKVGRHKVSQITYYSQGLGTADKSFDRLFGGVTGQGIDIDIILAYKFIVDNYEPGDELYFFGFSRGAYTVDIFTHTEDLK